MSGRFAWAGWGRCLQLSLPSFPYLCFNRRITSVGAHPGELIFSKHLAFFFIFVIFYMFVIFDIFYIFVIFSIFSIYDIFSIFVIFDILLIFDIYITKSKFTYIIYMTYLNKCCIFCIFDIFPLLLQLWEEGQPCSVQAR